MQLNKRIHPARPKLKLLPATEGACARSSGRSGNVVGFDIDRTRLCSLILLIVRDDRTRRSIGAVGKNGFAGNCLRHPPIWRCQRSEPRRMPGPSASGGILFQGRSLVLVLRMRTMKVSSSPHPASSLSSMGRSRRCGTDSFVGLCDSVNSLHHRCSGVLQQALRQNLCGRNQARSQSVRGSIRLRLQSAWNCVLASDRSRDPHGALWRAASSTSMWHCGGRKRLARSRRHVGPEYPLDVVERMVFVRSARLRRAGDEENWHRRHRPLDE